MMMRLRQHRVGATGFVGALMLSIVVTLLATATFAPTTARAAQTPVTFAAWGDAAPGSSTSSATTAFTRVAGSLASRSFSFSVATGDYVYITSSDTRAYMEAKYDSFLAAALPIRKSPVYYAPGNHELLSNSTARAVYHAKLGAPSTRWYQVQKGSLHILLLSAVEPGRTLGSIGYYGETSPSNTTPANWLVSTLKTIAAADRKAWVLIAAHYPLPEGTPTEPWYSSAGERPRLETLFRKYGVDGLLAGHIHYYRRHVEPDGTTHITQGTAGSPARTTTALPLDRYDRAAIGSVYGYTLLTRGADNTLKGVTYEASPSDWQFKLRDSFSLTNRSAQ
jgi:hypothetical protein